MTSRPGDTSSKTEATRWADTRFLPLTHASAAGRCASPRTQYLPTKAALLHASWGPLCGCQSSRVAPWLNAAQSRGVHSGRATDSPRLAFTLSSLGSPLPLPLRSVLSLSRAALDDNRIADFLPRFALPRRPLTTQHRHMSLQRLGLGTSTRHMAPALSAAARPTHTTAQEQRMTIHLGLTHRRFNSIDRSGDNHHTTTSLSTDALSLNPIPTAATSASATCSQRSY